MKIDFVGKKSQNL